jgi:hypothetical protein
VRCSKKRRVGADGVHPDPFASVGQRERDGELVVHAGLGDRADQADALDALAVLVCDLGYYRVAQSVLLPSGVCDRIDGQPSAARAAPTRSAGRQPGWRWRTTHSSSFL